MILWVALVVVIVTVVSQTIQYLFGLCKFGNVSDKGVVVVVGVDAVEDAAFVTCVQLLQKECTVHVIGNDEQVLAQLQSAAHAKSCSKHLHTYHVADDVNNNAADYANAANEISSAIGHDSKIWAMIVQTATGQLPAGHTVWTSVDVVGREFNNITLRTIRIVDAFGDMLREANGARLIITNHSLSQAPIAGFAVTCIASSSLNAYVDVLTQEFSEFNCAVLTVSTTFHHKNNTNPDEKEAVVEIHKHYGSDYYDAFMSGMEHYASGHSLSSVTPIVDCLVHTVVARFPRTLYYAGRKWHWTLVAALPVALRHLVLRINRRRVLRIPRPSLMTDTNSESDGRGESPLAIVVQGEKNKDTESL